MMYRDLTIALLALALLAGCSEEGADSARTESTSPEPAMTTQPAATTEPAMADEQAVAPSETTATSDPAAESSAESSAKVTALMDNGVIYQDEIYRDWPYTEAPAAASVQSAVADAADQVTAMAEDAGQQAGEMADTVSEAVTETADAAGEAMETAMSTASDKPYQVVDGGISENAMEGWKTYNGGGCGACHGKGGIGAVGPNLADSVTQKLSKEEFVNIVTNGVSGTMMRPHKTNKRVMDNLDNLYAYLVARGDGVLGPGNLIKSPMGKE